MIQTIQNLACVELTCSVEERRIAFSKDILRGKKIKSLFIYVSPDIEYQIKNPYRDELITTVGELSTLSLYLNLVDDNGNPFIENLSFDFLYKNIFDLNINKVLDFDQCSISIKALGIENPIRLLMYVLYDDTHVAEPTEEITGSITVFVPEPDYYYDIALIDIIDNKLKGKKIKKIISGYDNGIYLDLVSTEGKKIENVPIGIFSPSTTNEFYLDGFKIDYENSFLRYRTGMTSPISYLTFIY